MANNNQVNQTVENYDMAYASMAALQQQEELERDAYNRGDMTAAYSADTYQDAINLPADKTQNPTAMTLEHQSETMPENGMANDVLQNDTKGVTSDATIYLHRCSIKLQLYLVQIQLLVLSSKKLRIS